MELSWHPSKKFQTACFFQKTQNRDQSCSCNEENEEPVCFSGRIEAAIIQIPKLENIAFTIRIQFRGSQKRVSRFFKVV